ncbi:MAG: leucine--tRNA ligase [Nitrospirae bacterium]|nr:leucine--tRNA ligase [Nitrospirota bacterium]
MTKETTPQQPEVYSPQAIEPAWQQRWEAGKAFRVMKDPNRPKYYCLVMFPYPSGRIHMGHVRNYVIGDVVARYKSMRGLNVLHPMGWDAFGLPAENAAIERGVHPSKWTKENIATMRTQLKRMGLSYNWEREVATCDPDYYKWNQWFFLKMYERGLAYKKMSSVNWCPSCETVLANEQVIDGACWRCGSTVVQKELEQWFFKITAYAEELLSECDRLTGWPERVLTMQRNWIGKSIGVEVDFPLAGNSNKPIRIFTTRQDTLFGATFVTVAPEHPMVEEILRGKKEAAAVRKFVERIKKQDRTVRIAEDIEKEGTFTGAHAINPMTKERVPIWIGNFVLMEYGTGAIMCVPAHDQRDFEFAKKYGIPVRVVIQNPEGTLRSEDLSAAYVEEAGTLVDSGKFSGLIPREAQEKIAGFIESEKLGARRINYKLRDWGISRQRYWGTPIPIVYCKTCGTVPVPYDDLPVTLPQDVAFTGKGGSPLAADKNFLNVKCPKCKGSARRETDTMDTFVDSSWYFLRYLSPRLDSAPFDHQEADYWMPVDQYIGGIEHAVLHLLYARFFTKVIRDLGLVKINEPFTNLLTQGMVCMETYRCEEHGWLFPGEVIGSEKEGWRCPHCSRPVDRGRVEKMSKSKKNIVDPEQLIAKYGADTARLFSLFAAPPEKDLEWNDAGVEGASRFLNRVWRLVTNHATTKASTQVVRRHIDLDLPVSPQEAALRHMTHRTIKKVTEDLDRSFQFNTAIAALMEFYNTITEWEREGGPPGDHTAMDEALRTLVILLSPFAPHIAEELWKRLGHADSVFRQPWPKWNEGYLKTDEVTIVLQINGKLRSQILVPADLDEEGVRNRALADGKIMDWMKGQAPKKVIYVKGKLVNIVL